MVTVRSWGRLLSRSGLTTPSSEAPIQLDMLPQAVHSAYSCDCDRCGAVGELGAVISLILGKFNATK